MLNREEAAVLYVHDNFKSRRVLASILRECKFSVFAASGPMEAIRCCQETEFDLALLDYQMSAMTGSQLAHELKLLTPRLPIILLSGLAFLPASELLFVNAHFGCGTVLTDLVTTMRMLTRPRTVANRRYTAAAWSDST